MCKRMSFFVFIVLMLGLAGIVSADAISGVTATILVVVAGL